MIGEHFHITRGTACRIIYCVTHYIALLADKQNKMPNTIETRNKICNEFYNISGFPNVNGVKDGSYIRIQSSGVNNADIFNNLKGLFYIIIIKNFVTQNLVY